MTPDDTEVPLIDQMNAEIAKDAVTVTPEEIEKRITVEYANNYRRRHNAMALAKQQRRVRKIRKLKKMASFLRRAGEPLSAALEQTLRKVRSMVPCALRGQVKETVRSVNRLENCSTLAKNRREAINKETV